MEEENKNELNNSGIEHVRKDNSAPTIEKVKEKTVAELLNEALNKKGETQEYIYSEFIKEKKKESVKFVTKNEIKTWFNGTGYPDLDQTYQLAYLIPIDPAQIWQLKLKEEKKLQGRKKTKSSWFDLMDRFISGNQFILLCLLYGFIFTSVLFATSALRLLVDSYNHADEQSGYYIEGAIEAGAEYAGNVTGVESIANSVKSGVSNEIENKVTEMRNWLEQKENKDN